MRTTSWSCGRAARSFPSPRGSASARASRSAKLGEGGGHSRTPRGMTTHLLVTGLALGSMYGLVALGYHITCVTSRTMNFSQGHAVMAGAVVAYAGFVALGWPFPLALLIALVALAAYS